MAKSEIKYRVRISFVDDSYWDDGSRWTSEIFRFKKRQDAINFAEEALKKGCTVTGQNSSLTIRPDKRDITIYRDSSTQIDF
jgi:hypothetical protein